MRTLDGRGQYGANEGGGRDAGQQPENHGDPGTT